MAHFSRAVVARAVASLAVAAWTASTTGAPVAAHGTLITSIPMDQDTVDAPPAEIIAVFNEAIDPELSHMELRDPSGTTLAQGGDAPDDQSATTMRMTPPALAPGRYEVRWSVVTPNDGFLQRGSFAFSVAEAAPTGTPAATPSTSPVPTPTIGPSATPIASPTASPSATAPPGTTAGSGDLLLPFLALGTLVAVAVLLIRRPRRPPQDP